MIKAKHTSFYVWLADHYSRFFLNLVFRSIRFIGESPEKKDLGVLMIANHFMWWDGFIQMRLNLKIFKKKFHFMMLEEELLKAKVVQKAGACSVSKGSRGIIETLQHLVEVISHPGNLYLFFPQGEIQSIYTYPFKFEKGALNYILKKTSSDFQFVFNVNLIDFASFKRPELSVYYKTYEITDKTTSEDIERDYNDFAQVCMKKQRSE